MTYGVYLQVDRLIDRFVVASYIKLFKSIANLTFSFHCFINMYNMADGVESDLI